MGAQHARDRPDRPQLDNRDAQRRQRVESRGGCIERALGGERRDVDVEDRAPRVGPLPRLVGPVERRVERAAPAEQAVRLAGAARVGQRRAAVDREPVVGARRELVVGSPPVGHVHPDQAQGSALGLCGGPGSGVGPCAVLVVRCPAGQDDLDRAGARGPDDGTRPGDGDHGGVVGRLGGVAVARGHPACASPWARTSRTVANDETVRWSPARYVRGSGSAPSAVLTSVRHDAP
ncbi:hypothetical protein D3C74_289940 [compost metagenome]